MISHAITSTYKPANLIFYVVSQDFSALTKNKKRGIFTPIWEVWIPAVTYLYWCICSVRLLTFTFLTYTIFIFFHLVPISLSLQEYAILPSLLFPGHLGYSNYALKFLNFQQQKTVQLKIISVELLKIIYFIVFSSSKSGQSSSPASPVVRPVQ